MRGIAVMANLKSKTTKAKPGAKKAPNAIDKHVGSLVRMRRMQLSMSQEKLGAALGVTFQQVQKNEMGTNRIGASRLQQLSTILQVPVSFFFDGAPVEFHPKSKWKGGANTGKAPSPIYLTNVLATSDGLALFSAFSRIQDSGMRRSVVDLVEHIAPDADDQPVIDDKHEVVDFERASKAVRKK